MGVVFEEYEAWRWNRLIAGGTMAERRRRPVSNRHDAVARSVCTGAYRTWFGRGLDTLPRERLTQRGLFPSPNIELPVMPRQTRHSVQGQDPVRHHTGGPLKHAIYAALVRVSRRFVPSADVHEPRLAGLDDSAPGPTY